MDHHQLVRALAVLRIAIGVIALAAPGRATRPLLRGAAAAPGPKLLTRVFGVRDLALGLGALQALRENRDPQSWVRLGALCDAGDTIAMTAALTKTDLPRLAAAAAVISSTTAAVTGWRASAHL